ncbi:hypothetical protein ABZ837_27515 [Streptomyces sp. NPDC047197]|uniref:hypothetical protein n=1 Tax=Streptomyces sp. NPDC047197 TaxID=3155477 RepID=UPI0033FEA55F
MEIEGAKLLQLLDRFAGHLSDSLSVVSLVHWGAYFSIEHVELMEMALQDDFASAEVKPTSEQKSEAEKRARFAKSEKERGFPLLHGQALMGMWGALEAFIEDFCVACMESFPDSLRSANVKKIKITLSDFMKLSESDRLRYLVTEIQRERKVGLRSGVAVFEDLLNSIEINGKPQSRLGGEVDRKVRDILYEGQQIRNALAHRGGIADRRLCDACPNLQLVPGRQVLLSLDYIETFDAAARVYALTIMNRVLSLVGMPPVVDGPPGFEGALKVKYPPPVM